MAREELLIQYIKGRLMQLLSKSEIKTNDGLLDKLKEDYLDDFDNARRVLNVRRYLSLDSEKKTWFISVLKSDGFLTKKEYIDFLFMYLNVDTDEKAKAYIYKTLLEETLFSFENDDIEYIKKLLQDKDVLKIV
jgi:ribosomal protein S8